MNRIHDYDMFIDQITCVNGKCKRTTKASIYTTDRHSLHDKSNNACRLGARTQRDVIVQTRSFEPVDLRTRTRSSTVKRKLSNRYNKCLSLGNMTGFTVSIDGSAILDFQDREYTNRLLKEMHSSESGSVAGKAISFEGR